MTVGELIKELEKYDENLVVTDAEDFVIDEVSLSTNLDGEDYVQLCW